MTDAYRVDVESDHRATMFAPTGLLGPTNATLSALLVEDAPNMSFVSTGLLAQSCGETLNEVEDQTCMSLYDCLYQTQIF